MLMRTPSAHVGLLLIYERLDAPPSVAQGPMQCFECWVIVGIYHCFSARQQAKGPPQVTAPGTQTELSIWPCFETSDTLGPWC